MKNKPAGMKKDSFLLPSLTDAQEMAKKHPDTFDAPTKQELSVLKKGSIVKVCFDDQERMWASLERKEKKGWVAKLDNDPMTVPYQLGDLFYLEPKHIYAIYPA